MKKIIVLVVLFCGVTLFSQDLPKIVPPSPEASSLGKFTEMPVSYYTGLPSINVPIYTIQANGISIPIGLSYHARGIQVGEIAPRVGLGWALSYGGSLSRQIRESADESVKGYINNRITIDRALNSPSASTAGVNARQTIAIQTNLYPEYDLVPDKFIFNANGNSGNFVLNYKDLSTLQQKYSDVKIDYTLDGNNELTQFIITDKQGIKYHFGKSSDGSRSAYNKETVQATYTYNQSSGLNQSSGPSEGPFPNSWQLMDIITPQGGIIKFHYQWEELIYYRRSHDKVESNNIPQSYFSKIRSKQYHISQIEFDAGKVNFIKSTSERLDVEDGYTLDRIEVLDEKDKLIKKMQFGYEYKTASSTGDELGYLTSVEPKAAKRLYLSTVQQFDASSGSLPAHTFTYSSVELPNRFSNSQDVWGYFNGASNGQFLTFFNYGSNPIIRAVDTVKAEAGMLKKITYPTGGSTNFVYEHNKVIPSSLLNDVVMSSVNPIVRRDAGLSNLEYSMYYNSSTKTYEKPVVINDVFYNTIDFTVNFTDDAGCTTNEPECKFIVSIVGNGYNWSINYGETSTIGLPAGTYTLKVKPKGKYHDPYSFNNFFQVTMEWLEQDTPESDVLYAAGKRIKRVEFRDSDNDLLSYREYDYSNPSGESSGRLFGLPNFFSINEVQSIGGATIFEANGASPGVPLSVPQSNLVGYEYVTEFIGEASSNIGKTQYKFTVPYDFGNYYRFPHVIPTGAEWARGLMLETKHYKNTSGGFNLVKEVLNDYFFGNNPSIGGSSINSLYPPFLPPPIFTLDVNLVDFYPVTDYMYNKTNTSYRFPLIKISYEIDPSTGYPDYNGNLTYKTYYIVGGTQDLLRTTVKDYLDNGQIHTNITEYDYDYNSHYQLSEQSFTDSRGDILKTKYYYPTTGTLARENRIVPPYKTENYRGKTKLGETYTTYFTSIGNYLPNKIQTSKGGQSLEDRVVYHSYDNKGNPTEVSKKDGTHIVYIWGYQQSQPIAKIENATYADVTSYVSNLQGLSNLDDDRTIGAAGKEGDLRDALNALRAAFPDAQVTTFTYDPLIGVTSVTDPSGQVMYYYYDSFNRLQYVKDESGNVLKENQYHYKN